MNDHDLIAAIAALRDELAEARRYVRTRPALAFQGIAKSLIRLEDYCNRDDKITARAARWASNLAVGLDSIQAAPKVLEGYIDGTSWELLGVQAAIEKAIKPPDAEMPHQSDSVTLPVPWPGPGR